MGCRTQLGARLRQWCATVGHCDMKLSSTIVSCCTHGMQYPVNYKLDMSAPSLLCLPVSTQPRTLVTYLVSQCLACPLPPPPPSPFLSPQVLLSLAISCPQKVAYSLLSHFLAPPCEPFPCCPTGALESPTSAVRFALPERHTLFCLLPLQ